MSLIILNIVCVLCVYMIHLQVKYDNERIKKELIKKNIESRSNRRSDSVVSLDNHFLNLGDDRHHSIHSISSNTAINSKERDARLNNHTNNFLPSFNLQIETPTTDDVFFDKKYNNNNKNNNNTITNMQYFDI